MLCKTGHKDLNYKPLHHNSSCSSHTSIWLYSYGRSDSISAYLDRPLSAISETWEGNNNRWD